MDTAKLKVRLEKIFSKKTLAKIGQFWYFCVWNFTRNNLWESASACSFGFVFSFIPVTLIIFTLLTGFLRINPNITDYIFAFSREFESLIDIQPILEQMLSRHQFTFMDIFLGIWIIWMARKLFRSIIQGMNKIFRSVTARKSWFNQVLIFLLEFLLILLIVVIILFSFAFSQLLRQPFFVSLFANFPHLFSYGSHNIVVLVMYLIIFLSTFILYRFVSGTKPRTRLCFFYALINTVASFLVSFFINRFINLANYNIVYGTISSLVLLMLKVYAFFFLILFFAQAIYVSQFFETLLRSEIYLLPDGDDSDLKNYFRRLLFINPIALKTSENSVHFKAGDVLYTKGTPLDFVYFIRRGQVREDSEKQTLYFGEGAFIGEVACILNVARVATATAVTDCKMLKFTPEEFREIIKQNPDAAVRALDKISLFML